MFQLNNAFCWFFLNLFSNKFRGQNLNPLEKFSFFTQRWPWKSDFYDLYEFRLHAVLSLYFQIFKAHISPPYKAISIEFEENFKPSNTYLCDSTVFQARFHLRDGFIQIFIQFWGLRGTMRDGLSKKSCIRVQRLTIWNFIQIFV